MSSDVVGAASRISSHTFTDVGPFDRAAEGEWIRGWYAIVCRMPAADGCDAALEIMPEVAGDDEWALFGSYDHIRNVVSVALCANPFETLCTLVHEVAHASSNQRHVRPHGYSWRRTFAQLATELLDADPLPLARDIRSRYRPNVFSRQSALDLAVMRLMMEDRPLLKVDRCDGKLSVRAVVGGRVLTARADPP